MTEIEAIKAIKSNRPTSGYIILNEALGMAINALEKQIPKQITRDISKEEENRAYYFCPICCKWLTKMTNYCCKCGQKLDWSE